MSDNDGFTRFWYTVTKIALAVAFLWLQGKLLFWLGAWP